MTDVILHFIPISGLVESDTNGKTDVFVYDRVNKTMQLASLSGSGEQGNGSVGLLPVQTAASLPSSRGANNMVEGDTTAVMMYLSAT